MREMVCQHADAEAVEMVAHQPASATAASHYTDVRLPTLAKYFDYIQKCVASKQPQEAALKNGVALPYETVAPSCPVPKVLKVRIELQAIHCGACAVRAFRDLVGSEAGVFHSQRLARQPDKLDPVADERALSICGRANLVQDTQLTTRIDRS